MYSRILMQSNCPCQIAGTAIDNDGSGLADRWHVPCFFHNLRAHYKYRGRQERETMQTPATAEYFKELAEQGSEGAFEEDLKGSLAVGKLGDVAVLSQDILTIDEDAIPQTKAVYTIVGGEIVFRGGGD